MNSKLSVETIPLDGGALVRLTGTIDETTDAQALLPGTADIVIFDLDGVRRITSYGVLQWVKALKELRARYYGFMRCHPAIVRQFNMVAGFGRHGDVLSIYLPYFCEACDHQFETLLDLRSEYAVVQSCVPPDARCPSCGEQAEFDDVARSYLAFSGDYPRPNPPDPIARLMMDPSRTAAGGSITAPDAALARADARTPTGTRDAPFRESVHPKRDTGLATAPSSSLSGSVEPFRKLQDDLDVTRDRLNRMINERKSKS